MSLSSSVIIDTLYLLILISKKSTAATAKNGKILYIYITKIKNKV